MQIELGMFEYNWFVRNYFLAQTETTSGSIRSVAFRFCSRLSIINNSSSLSNSSKKTEPIHSPPSFFACVTTEKKLQNFTFH